jgi:ATP-dependent DNA helicase PIF1
MINQIVCAELPRIGTKLYDIVTNFMLHGPCGQINPTCSCMLNEFKVCSKGYPKEFSNETIENVNGFPQYRRRQITATQFTKPYRITGNPNYQHVFTNRDVVPYNSYLLLKYNAHINVEICSTIKSVKYLYKYVYKGHDRANVLITDEIENYLECRYLCAQEACWRLFQFEMEGNMHTVVTLQIHEPGEQRIYYHEGDEDRVVEESTNKNTMLTAWFALNSHDLHAKTLLYAEVGEQYVWNKANRVWTRRQVIYKSKKKLYKLSNAINYPKINSAVKKKRSQGFQR